MAGIDFLSECEYERDVADGLLDGIVRAGHVVCLVEPRCGLCFCCEVSRTSSAGAPRARPTPGSASRCSAR